MTQGTYVQFTFDLSCNYSDLKSVEIIFWQENYNGLSSDRPLPITKTLQQCNQGDKSNQLVVTLSREETLRFSDERKAYMSLTAILQNDKKIASYKNIIAVYPTHNNLMEDNTLPTPTYDGWIYLDGETIEQWG
jgi:hypothetical protein